MKQDPQWVHNLRPAGQAKLPIGRAVMAAPGIASPRGKPHSTPSRPGGSQLLARPDPRPAAYDGRQVMTTAGEDDSDRACHPWADLTKRAADVLAYFDRPGTSNGPTEAINGRLEHLRGSFLVSIRQCAGGAETGPAPPTPSGGVRGPA